MRTSNKNIYNTWIFPQMTSSGATLSSSPKIAFSKSSENGQVQTFITQPKIDVLKRFLFASNDWELQICQIKNWGQFGSDLPLRLISLVLVINFDPRFYETSPFSKQCAYAITRNGDFWYRQYHTSLVSSVFESQDEVLGVMKCQRYLF